jgi:hypothetical protein
MNQFLLVDGAMVHAAITGSKLFPSTGAPWFTTLMPHQGLGLAGPLLLSRGPVAESARAAFDAEIGRLAGQFPNRQHLSFINTDESFDALASHLRRFVYFGDDTGVPYGLRIADNRVLAYLPRVLTADQWNAMTSLVVRWQAHDRTGHPVDLPLHAAPNEFKGHAAHLSLNDEQIARLIDEGEPDALLARLQLEPESMAAKEMDMHYGMATRCVQHWRASGNQDRNALLSFGRRVFAGGMATAGDRAAMQKLLQSAIAAVR